MLSENSGALKDTIANFKVFSEGLARNTGKLDGIVAGLEKMTGGGPADRPKITYDLRAPQDLDAPSQNPQGTVGRSRSRPRLRCCRRSGSCSSPHRRYPGFAEAMWAEAIPKLLQARLIESFENYDIAHAPLRAADIGQTDFQLLIDVRKFRIAMDSDPVAEIGLSAKIVDKDGKVVASRLFEESERLDKVEPPATVVAFDDAFARIARNMIAWTVQAE